MLSFIFSYLPLVRKVKSLFRTNALMSKVFCMENERNAYTYNVLILTSQYFLNRRVARGVWGGGPVMHHA